MFFHVFKKNNILNKNRMPGKEKGTYILILYLQQKHFIDIGKLGQFYFKRGYYSYVGSAFGPGGLRARLTHHVKIADKPHWHIDYLRKKAKIKEIWVTDHFEKIEHEWALNLRKMDGASIPVPGFGCSDCKCPAHLFYFQHRPLNKQFQKIAAGMGNKILTPQ